MHTRSELHGLLARVRRRWTALVLLRTAGRACAAAAVPILAAIATERIVPLDTAPLSLLGLAAVLASVSLAGAVFWRMQRRPDDRRVARFVEERAAATGAGELDDALVSAVDVEQRTSTGFGPLIVAHAVALLREMSPARLIDTRTMRRAAFEAAGGVTVCALTVVLAAPLLRRGVESAWVTLFPQSLQIDVTPGDARVVAGQPVAIRAVLRGPRTTLTRLRPALTVSAGGERRTVDMQPVGGGFEYRFESVDRTFAYTVTAASAASRSYTVTALFEPRVQRIDLRYVYPGFTGLSPRDDTDGGDIYAPAGTRVRLRIHADKPVRAGTIAFSKTSTALRAIEASVLETEIVLAKDDSYRVALADGDGLRSSGETEYYIRVMDDRPPEVRILRPSADQQITPLEEVAIEARADDDYGVARLDLVYAVPGRPARTIPFTRVSGTETAKVGAHLLSAEELGVQPGDVITYYARARDIARGRRATETKSDIFFLEVKPFGEEFVAAQSQAMGGGASGDAQLEALIAAQKEIINATWNLERRAGSSGSRSAADIQAVMQAQAELKARAEQIIARGGRRRPPPRMPQQVAPAQPPRANALDPVSAAVDAMERAVEQLQGQRTREAIAHEMAALQGLLRAQAEVRRRQVMQQQASGASSGGSARQGQDLSALFDRELQRQQRTNYEQRSQIEERPEQDDNDQSALDRIRDLARRQEELSRRQRALAEQGLTAEELKRQLERLTREQNELRQEAEDLARRMGSSGSSSAQGQQSRGQQNRSQQEQTGGSAMRDVTEQMRSAASDLRREDPKAAAGAAERAADRLRRLEEQLRAGSPEARQRAAGELQLDAQQIAEAQRRIGDEAGRLDASTADRAADARRRLAGEKDRLAERVDDLQRRAEQLAREGTKTPGGAAVSDAAAELSRQQLGTRMRDSAKQMRAAAEAKGAGEATKGSHKEAEEQIARALDRVVEKLGGRVGAEAGRLVDQLDRTGEVRNRLNDLERQIRQAEGQQRDQSAKGAEHEAAGQRGAPGPKNPTNELQRLRDEYARELQRARQTLGRMDGEPRTGTGMSTPERHEFSRSAPGTEAFKQDFAAWESLRKEIDLALEKYEAAVSARLAGKLSEDRLNGGGSDRVPEAYKKLIAKYYESLAKR